MRILKFFNSIIASDINNVGMVVDEILGYLAKVYHINEDCLIFDSKVILNELILNAIKHGNREDISKSVKITGAIVEDKYLMFQIEDEGEGYNICQSSQNTHTDCTDIDSLLENGRGMIIVNCLCDKIKFNKKGNKVLVMKRMVSQ